MNTMLTRSFYERKTLDIARDLLGCYLVRRIGRRTIHAKIVEIEAYIGEDDLACHASKGRTPRTEIMYGEAGHAYVYLIYGMYHCLNIVTEQEGFPAAILIRAVEIEGVLFKETNGPGKLCRFLNIDKAVNGMDMTKERGLWVEKGESISDSMVQLSKRIGVDYARHCKEYLWRFTLEKKLVEA